MGRYLSHFGSSGAAVQKRAAALVDLAAGAKCRGRSAVLSHFVTQRLGLYSGRVARVDKGG